VFSPFIIGGRTPLIKCLYNNLCFHPCMHWKGPRMLSSSRAQETSCCTTFHTVSTLSFIWELFFSLDLSSHYNTSLDLTGTPAQSLCALVQFLSPDFSLFFAFMFDNNSSCHNTYPSQNRVSIFISLLYFSSIIKVFIKSPFEKSQSLNLTFLEKSPLH